MSELDIKAVDALYDECKRVLLKKNRDYGTKNISQSPGGALNGIRVRMHDKVARINNLIDTNRDPENESLRDSFLDILNYAAIAMMVLDGDWPGAEDNKPPAVTPLQPPSPYPGIVIPPYSPFTSPLITHSSGGFVDGVSTGVDNHPHTDDEEGCVSDCAE